MRSPRCVVGNYSNEHEYELTVVEEPDFGAEVTDNPWTGTHMGPFIKHMNWALAAVICLPESFSSRWVPGMMWWFPFEPDAYSGWCFVLEAFF